MKKWIIRRYEYVDHIQLHGVILSLAKVMRPYISPGPSGRIKNGGLGWALLRGTDQVNWFPTKAAGVSWLKKNSERFVVDGSLYERETS